MRVVFASRDYLQVLPLIFALRFLSLEGSLGLSIACHGSMG